MQLQHISFADATSSDEDGAVEARHAWACAPLSRAPWAVAAVGIVAVVCIAASSGLTGPRQSSELERAAIKPDAKFLTQQFSASTSGSMMSQAVAGPSPAGAAATTATAATATATAGGDGCSTDEEGLLGLCYDKCSSLTNGEYPYRQSAWTCCQTAECTKNPFEMFKCCKHNMGWCSGFDIAGMHEGNKVCPHKPGACAADEELFLGMCYMKCSLIDPTLPYRVGPASCCKTTSAFCMFEEGVKDGLTGESLTDPKFNIGSGCDDSSSTTSCSAHPPLTSYVS